MSQRLPLKLVRTMLTTLLLLFVAATLGTIVAQEISRVEDPRPITASEEDTVSESMSILDADSPVGEIAESHSGEFAPDTDLEAEQPAPVDIESSVSPAQVSCIVEAVYFHNTHRCVTCLKIEADAKAIVEQTFAQELAAGTLRWLTINMEENPSYIATYELASPSLVLRRVVDGQIVDWVTLEETWALVRSTTRYSAYIIDSFSTFIAGCR